MRLQEIGPRCGLDKYDSGQGGLAGCFEHGNEPSSSLRRVEYFHQLRNCQRLKKESAPRRWLIVWTAFTQLMFRRVIHFCFYVDGCSHSIIQNLASRKDRCLTFSNFEEIYLVKLIQFSEKHSFINFHSPVQLVMTAMDPASCNTLATLHHESRSKDRPSVALVHQFSPIST